MHEDLLIRKREFEPELECEALPTMTQLACNIRGTTESVPGVLRPFAEPLSEPHLALTLRVNAK